MSTLPPSPEAGTDSDALESAGTSPAPQPFKPPFFIIGCVRSGTTMLRDILRMHPHLVSPEETHFFRWSEPFGTERYIRIVSDNKELQQHRGIDGITEEEFSRMLAASRSRDELYYKYMRLFAERNKPAATRWFDKTPQNVYGAALAAATMPNARFIHLVRNPVNVVSSLRIGKVMKVGRIVGACNYWNEAVDTVMTVKRAWPGRVLEIRYEDFVAAPMQHLPALLEFVGEPFDASWFAGVETIEVDHSESGVLSEEDLDRVKRLCAAGRSRYGYQQEGEAGAPATKA